MTVQREPQRRRWFVLAAVALAGAAVLLNAIERPAPAPRPTATTTTRAVEMPSAPLAAPEAVRREPERPPARELRRVARRFLRGYVEHVYGRAPARRIDCAARTLRRRLRREDRRRPVRAAGQRARVRRLRVGGYVPDARAWRVTAQVADGRNVVYPIELLVREERGRLVVTATGSAG